MSIESKCNRLVSIQRRYDLAESTTLIFAEKTQTTEGSNVDQPGSDFKFDYEDPGYTTIIAKYPCYIKDSLGGIRYVPNEQGEVYRGRATMAGILTDKIREGDVVDGKWKVVGEPELNLIQRTTSCSLVRL